MYLSFTILLTEALKQKFYFFVLTIFFVRAGNYFFLPFINESSKFYRMRVVRSGRGGGYKSNSNTFYPYTF